MVWLKAFVLGIVQGVTEFLPVSSSGHLVLARHVFGLEEAGAAFDILLHVATMIAIVIVYQRDLVGLIRTAVDVLRRQARPEDRDLLVGLIIGIVPVSVVGVLFADRLETAFADPRRAAAMLLVTAALLFASHAFRHRAGRVTPGRALVVGLFQVLAILPGISRSGTTISAGMFAGMSPDRAARFSFLMAVPLFAGAAVVKLPDLAESRSLIPPGAMAIGFLASLVSGYLSIRWLLRVIARGKFVYFGVYCAIVGLLGIVLS